MATGDKKPVVMGEEKGVAGGVATLDANGILDSLQWPGVDNFGAADRILSNLTDPAQALSNIGAKSNENLLDNWYFADPIDQRGGYVVKPNVTYYLNGSAAGVTDTYYKVDGYDTAGNAKLTINGTQYLVYAKDIVRGYVGAGYTIDRWLTNSAAMVVSVSSDGTGVSVKNTNTGTAYEFNQRMENGFTELGGEAFACSCLADNQLYTISGEIADAAPTATTYYASQKFDFGVFRFGYSAVSGRFFICFLISADTEITINAVKLELGSEQTLAHQDSSGNWVLNDPPPNKQQELAKCQRYQVVIKSMQYGIGRTFSASDTTAGVFVPLPVTLRSNATVTSAGAATVRNLINGNAAEGTPNPTAYVKDNAVEIQVVIPTGFGTLVPCMTEIFADANTPLILDANL